MVKSDYTLSTTNSYSDNINPDWIFWIVGGESNKEKNQLEIITNLIKQNVSLSIETRLLEKNGINILTSPIVKKLLNAGYCKINQKELTFVFPEINSDNLYHFIVYINEIYHALLEPKNSYKNFPTTYLMQVDKGCYESFSIRNLHWYDFESSQFINKLIELVFDNTELPPIVTTANLMDSTIKISKQKVIYHLTNFAAENIYFFEFIFSQENFNKNKIVKDSEIDGDFSEYKNREKFVSLFLDRAINNEKNIKNFLYKFDIENKSEIKKFFPLLNTKYIDLMQSLLILKEFYLSDTQENFLLIEEVSTLVNSIPNGFISYSEIKAKILEQFPNISEETFNQLMNQYETEYIQKKDFNFDQKNIKILINFANENEYIYFSLTNYDFFINNGIKNLDKSLRENIVGDWTKKIKNHIFSSEMFLKDSFNLYILEKIKKIDNVMFQIIKNIETYQNLSGMMVISKFSRILLLNGENNISEVFKLNNLELYKSILQKIIDTKGILGKLFFKLFHWLSFKNFTTYSPVNPDILKDKKTVVKKEAKTEADLIFLTNINYPSFDALENDTQKLWDKIPIEKLTRRELDMNIATDLNELLKNRKGVKFKTIFIIVERNTNRMIKKAPHLEHYRDTLYQYIKNSICLIIQKESNFRSRISF